MTNPKILIGCFGVPGYGGAATSRYKLFDRMQAEGRRVSFVNIIAASEFRRLMNRFGENAGNPYRLPGVYTCVIESEGELLAAHEPLRQTMSELAPDILIGGGDFASILMKLAAPATPLIFTTGGSRLVRAALERGSLAELTERRLEFSSLPDSELKAIGLADLVVTHSPMLLELYRHYYTSFAAKIHPQVFWLGALTHHESLRHRASKLPQSERDIDLVFVASLWNRTVKNFPMVKEIIARCPELNIHVVGEVEEEFGEATYHGTLPAREEVYALLGRSRTLACPSLFDGAPGILFEASRMECQMVASKNCGNWNFCNSELIVEHFSADAFAEKIRLSLRENLADRYDGEMCEASYGKFIDTIDEFLR